MVSMQDIIGIFDLENTSTEQITKDYLSKAQKAGRIIEVNNSELPKSFVVCVSEGPEKFNVYLSQFSPTTLYKRVKDPFGGF